MYKLPVIVDKKLAKVKKAIFSSGSLNYSVEMAVDDFVKLENAVLANFGIKKKIKIQKVVAKKKKTNVKKNPKKALVKKNVVFKNKKKVAKKPIKKTVKKPSSKKKK
jgi:hypothetical protein